MDHDLSGRTVVITGAARGQGAAEVHPRIEEGEIGRLPLSAYRHCAESFPRVHLQSWRIRVPMSIRRSHNFGW